MLDALRDLAARRAVARAVAMRPPPTPGARLHARHVLAVLPPDPSRAVWELLARIDLPPAQVHLVALGRCSPPDRFAGTVTISAPGDRDWRGLPRRAVAEAAWAARPDVAINLAPPDDLAAQYLVGASPAWVRVARHETASEAFYDLFVAEAAPGGGPDPERLARLLARLDPPLLPLVAA